MLYFKACPKCLGDMHLTEDMYGAYKECMQCGLIQAIEAPKIVRVRVRKASKAA